MHEALKVGSILSEYSLFLSNEFSKHQTSSNTFISL